MFCTRSIEDEFSFRVEINVDGFDPNDISVHLDAKGMLTVCGKFERRSKDDEGDYVNRQFRRQYHVPDGCILEQLRSRLSKEKILIIEAPKKPKTKEVKHIDIELLE